MRIHLPNILTSLNLFCGCIAGVMIFRNHIDWAAYFIFASAIFDMLDGAVARKVLSDPLLGKQLDSLADVVSFGFVPGAIMFKLLQHSGLEEIAGQNAARYLQFIPFTITVFSALRLARFNIDTRQTVSFIGLPTPANTLLVISFPLILLQHPGVYDHIILNPYFIIFTSLALSAMLVSGLRLFAFKFNNLSFKDNKYQFLLLIAGILLVPFLLFTAVPVLLFLYVFLSWLHFRNEPQTD